MVGAWLLENMFENNPANAQIANDIVSFLSDHKTTATHSRHLPLSKCQEIKLNVLMLEDDKELQDLVLTVHHAYMHTFSMSPAIKITENHLGVATVLMGVPQAGGPAQPPNQSAANHQAPLPPGVPVNEPAPEPEPPKA